ncbi:hypothetical protein G6011_10601 [Alternaria panax]|uniref:Hypersensitive response inducing protein 1 n=1 Tax=Alternaria panax TaxID=48097 RepID=A0AAD4ICA0_9PLEO|nr:hypothetical protein G6011_10601 [Alternaria panax]
MHLFVIFFFATVAMAAPDSFDSRGDEGCIPISYTISDYKLGKSWLVEFAFKSIFPTDNVDDSVQASTHCGGSGVTVPNNNECQVSNRRLLFDLRGPQEQAYYQISHSWTCRSNQWMSGNAVKVDSLDCYNDGDERVCTSGPQTLAPQNVRKICNSPRC